MVKMKEHKAHQRQGQQRKVVGLVEKIDGEHADRRSNEEIS
jgi:hypothetical protein